MSLTSFVEQSEIRSRIMEIFPNQGTPSSDPRKVEPRANNPQRVGTAFDYLCRWWVRSRTDNPYEYQWVAENALPVAEEICPKRVPELEAVIRTAKDRRDEFLKTQTLTRPLVESALDLASIDTIYRAKREPSGLGEYHEADIVDLIDLVAQLPESDLSNGSVAYLNPTFGAASPLVGGADADLIIDNTLIDIKTVKNPSFKAEDWRQLVGYLVLADIHEVFHETDVYTLYESYREERLPDIKSFGIYFSRSGAISEIPAKEIYGDSEYEDFRSWFALAAAEQHPRWSAKFGDFL